MKNRITLISLLSAGLVCGAISMPAMAGHDRYDPPKYQHHYDKSHYKSHNYHKRGKSQHYGYRKHYRHPGYNAYQRHYHHYRLPPRRPVYHAPRLIFSFGF